jgi:2-dehydro-3-deoxy-D-arabinonate dehydratase
MELTRHETYGGIRWARDGRLLPEGFELGLVLGGGAREAVAALAGLEVGEEVGEEARLLTPVEAGQEVWASGVTYLRSREAREAESQVKDVYEMVYEAERPELFFKAAGSRVRGHGETIRVRGDSVWDVPEPELTLLVTADGDVVGWSVGNDVSSRSIEGENPLYLPQAKVYDGSCAVGPGVRIAGVEEMGELGIALAIWREGERVFGGETGVAAMRRGLAELAGWLVKELSFPGGVYLMTGTGIVPPESFSLREGDEVEIVIGGMVLRNRVGGLSGA